MAAQSPYRKGRPRDPTRAGSGERREIRRALEAGKSEAEIVAEFVHRGFAKETVSSAVREVDEAIELDLDRGPPPPADECDELGDHFWGVHGTRPSLTAAQLRAALPVLLVFGIWAILVSLVVHFCG